MVRIIVDFGIEILKLVHISFNDISQAGYRGILSILGTLYQLQHLDGPLAVGCHHHVTICLPANCTNKLIDVLILPISIKERSYCVELKLEQMFTQS